MSRTKEIEVVRERQRESFYFLGERKSTWEVGGTPGDKVFCIKGVTVIVYFSVEKGDDCV
ncbi:hypothetical protein WN55_09066 [Dufourea novaeangliae]|uniref:Uncharacterized protein n=1 Tax=Dufourea novaeangliae TaxID=178035 RepID=A0A154P825_DUFNO|nr:hypothetical protein WN55_09066 [Dufourea novaeangliae]